MTDSSKTKRAPREHETREAEERKLEWHHPAALDTPPAPEGYRLRWIRYILEGREDGKRMTNVIRQGYTPVQADEEWLPPGWVIDKTEDGKYSGVVRSGDLILCKIPEEVARQRKEYYDARADRQEAAVSQALMKENRPEMPISSDSKNRTATGKGSSIFQE